MAGFRQEIITQVVGTVVGGLILAMLTGSGSGSKFLRILIAAGVVAVVVVILARR
jgi:uncharacterized membrane protein YeaQ/YmgE (transglycosylase-associated protein family)